MTEETGAAAPTDEQAVTAPAESEQATQTQEQPKQEAAPENAETKQTDDTEDDRPQKLTRNQRLQRKAARLAGLVAEQAARLEELEKKSAAGATDDAPKHADYPQGEWDPGYIADLAAHKAAKKIGETLSDRDKRRDAEKAITARQEMIDDFEERAAAFKVLTPDFDDSISELSKSLPNGLSPHLIEELYESEVGPAVLYQLAKNPARAAEINAMSPREVAREIGRLEGKTSLPNPKKQTSAPPPLKTPSGAAAKPVDIGTIAKSDNMDAYVTMRRQQEKARA